MMYVNTNVTALNNQRYLNNINKNLNTTYQRLASGLRINSAKDDAAGLQIMDRMTAQINGLTQGNRNANDGIALAQTMEGGMDEIHGMLQQMRTLAVQAANGTNTAEDRKSLNTQAAQLSAEITRIAQQTTFGGRQVLDGAGANSMFTTAQMSLQVGANNGDTVTLDAAAVDFKTLYGATAAKLSTAAVAGATLDSIDAAIAKLDANRGNLGAIQNRLESSIRNQENVIANQSDARSRIRDTDFALESANLAQQSIIQQAAASMLMQANARPQLALRMIG